MQALTDLGVQAKKGSCRLSCHLANGLRCEVKEMVQLHFLLGRFSWNFQFKILEGSPFPIILGLDFLSHSKMVMDLEGREYYFHFAPHQPMKFEGLIENMKEEGRGVSSYFQQLARDASKIVTLSSACPEPNPLEEVLNEYSELFSGQLGTVKGAEYEIELVDQVPVRSPPYHCAPPKLKLLKEFVEDLLRKGVVRPSKSPYASQAFLLPKSGGGYRMVVDYRKVNKKSCFDSYPLPKIEQAFQHFSGSTVFSVLDLNSAYYQIPLTRKSRRITAFCTPFGLYKFNKLPMGISIGCQGLSCVVDNLFADLKGKYVLITWMIW
jgi:hypothetical protein